MQSVIKELIANCLQNSKDDIIENLVWIDKYLSSDEDQIFYRINKLQKYQINDFLDTVVQKKIQPPSESLYNLTTLVIANLACGDFDQLQEMLKVDNIIPFIVEMLQQDSVRVVENVIRNIVRQACSR